MNYHVNNLEQYMAEGDPDILIELYKFIENIRDEVLKEPNHPQLEFLYYALKGPYASSFLSISETKIKERFGRIINQQRHEELELIKQYKDQKKKKRHQS